MFHLGEAVLLQPGCWGLWFWGTGSQAGACARDAPTPFCSPGPDVRSAARAWPWHTRQTSASLPEQPHAEGLLVAIQLLHALLHLHGHGHRLHLGDASLQLHHWPLHWHARHHARHEGRCVSLNRTRLKAPSEAAACICPMPLKACGASTHQPALCRP